MTYHVSDFLLAGDEVYVWVVPPEKGRTHGDRLRCKTSAMDMFHAYAMGVMR